MWEYNYDYSDYLMHYGVKGMRWGVRRKYLDKDGTATTKGEIQTYNTIVARGKYINNNLNKTDYHNRRIPIKVRKKDNKKLLKIINKDPITEQEIKLMNKKDDTLKKEMQYVYNVIKKNNLEKKYGESAKDLYNFVDNKLQEKNDKKYNKLIDQSAKAYRDLSEYYIKNIGKRTNKYKNILSADGNRSKQFKYGSNFSKEYRNMYDSASKYSKSNKEYLAKKYLKQENKLNKKYDMEGFIESDKLRKKYGIDAYLKSKSRR